MRPMRPRHLLTVVAALVVLITACVAPPPPPPPASPPRPATTQKPPTTRPATTVPPTTEPAAQASCRLPQGASGAPASARAAGAPDTLSVGEATAALGEVDGDTAVLITVDDHQRPAFTTIDATDTTTVTAAAVSGTLVSVTTNERGSAAAGSINDPHRPLQWAFDTFGYERAWACGNAGDGVVVAVLDTGVQGDHPDLDGRVMTGTTFLDRGPEPQGPGWVDPNGHGTHVATTIAAGADDGVGIAGVAPRATVLPVRVLDAAGDGWSVDVANGITWAVDAGADVINLSLTFSGYAKDVELATDYAETNGVVVVAAGGNDPDLAVAPYPAASLTVLGVSAIDEHRTIAGFSTPGSHIDVAAPGVGILAGVPTDRWAYSSGTSMAAPHVAGIAALMVATDDTYSPYAVRERIVTTAEDLGAPGVDPFYGWGALDPDSVFIYD